MPQAVVNFLALLGWNPGTEQEIFSRDELVQAFSFDRCSKSGAKFDIEKAKWFNHKYIQETPNEVLAKTFAPLVAAQGYYGNLSFIIGVVGLVKERVNFVQELWSQSSFFFVAPKSYDEKTVKKRWKPETPAQLMELTKVLKGIDDFSAQNQERVVKQWIEDNNYRIGDIMNAFRLAIVGESKGPHMFDITALIQKEETIRRLYAACKSIEIP